MIDPKTNRTLREYTAFVTFMYVLLPVDCGQYYTDSGISEPIAKVGRDTAGFGAGAIARLGNCRTGNGSHILS